VNHYETLGVERDADPVTIKRAYRKLAQKHHPDRRGGDKETFQRVAKAWEVLGGPERRAYYDQHGEDPQAKGNAEDGLVMQVLAQTLQRVMDDSDVTHDNILIMASDAIKGGMEQVRELRKQVQKEIAKCEQALQRLEDPDGLIADLLRARLQGKQKELADADQSTRVGERVLGLLVKARYRTDEKPSTTVDRNPYASIEKQFADIMRGTSFRY